jgi:hypothetical protein
MSIRSHKQQGAISPVFDVLRVPPPGCPGVRVCTDAQRIEDENSRLRKLLLLAVEHLPAGAVRLEIEHEIF